VTSCLGQKTLRTCFLLFLTYNPNPTRHLPSGPRLRTASSQPTSILSLLQYHNVITGLHRVFIQFPSNPLVPKSIPKADAHAAILLNHALTMIIFAYRSMATQDILHVFSELYQYLWKAVITIIGIMLAYPYRHRRLRAREYFHLA
jgi:hypothetical protein